MDCKLASIDAAAVFSVSCQLLTETEFCIVGCVYILLLLNSLAFRSVPWGDTAYCEAPKAGMAGCHSVTASVFTASMRPKLVGSTEAKGPGVADMAEAMQLGAAGEKLN